MSRPFLDERVCRLLVLADRELAAEIRTTGCACGGTLHSARYPRKLRGDLPAGLADDYSRRESLCCARDGCRRRTTPPSLRFLGRRQFAAAVVVLVSAMATGVTGKRAAVLREHVGVSTRTLERWRRWWVRTLPNTVFWKEAGPRFMPPVDEHRLPLSLLERFTRGPGLELERCLRFLGPFTMDDGGTVTV